MNPSAAFLLQAPAKITLYLHVIGQRSDGFHTIDSLTSFANIADTLTFKPLADFRLRVGGPFASQLGTIGNNLVTRAVRLFANKAGVKPTGEIFLKKNLPVAAGLGGGSSDAATALHGVGQLWDISPERVLSIEDLVSLGADMPICFHGKCASVGGIGEVIHSNSSLPNAWLLLANPGVSIATKDVYERLMPPYNSSKHAHQLYKPANVVDLANALRQTRNDLTPAACLFAPAIRLVLRSLGAMNDCLLARMCGSGATCFGLFQSEDAVRASEEMLKSKYPTWWVRRTSLL